MRLLLTKKWNFLIKNTYFLSFFLGFISFLFLPLINLKGNILNESFYPPIHKTSTDFPRVLCWIMTSPHTILSKAVYVKNTWGRNCDILLFMSTKPSPYLGVVVLPVLEGYEHLWLKTKAAFYHIYKHYLRKAEWFLKADDDTFVVVENLKHFLKDFNHTKSYYFGRKFRPYVKNGYMSGGAGYVLSRGAVHCLFSKEMREILKNSCYQFFTGYEDIDLGHCMMDCKAIAGDTRDELARERFHPFNLFITFDDDLLKKSSWVFNYSFYPYKMGVDGCSDHSISFHYTSPDDMLAYQFFLYQLKISKIK